MSGVCSAILAGGLNQECQAAASEIVNVIICSTTTKYSNSDKEDLTKWTDDIQQNNTMSVLPGLINYSPTTDDPNIITNAVSKAKSINNNPVPSFEFILDSNSCDFKEILQSYQGGNYGVFFEHSDGTIEGWDDQSGTDIGYLKPFTAQVKAYTKGAQEIDSNESFKLYINFKKYSQVENYFMFSPSWSVDSLLESMPVGIALRKTAIFAADDQTVSAKIRCASGYTGLVVADFETSATMSNVSTPAVTAVVDDGGGNYTLTVQKSVVPESLTANDQVVLRVKKLSTLVITHLSGWITVEGV
jgi:hypothetical protein